MDVDTLNKVRALGPDALRVVNWGIRLEGALHVIAEHPETHGDDVEKIKAMALDAILEDDEK